MINMKYLAALTLCGTLTLALAACGSDTVSDDAAQEQVSQESPKEQKGAENMHLANPFETFQSLEEAEKAAGFTMSLPTSAFPEGYNVSAYRVLMTGQKMIEVIVRNANAEIRFRKGGPDNNSGVYEQYPDTAQEDIDGIAVTFGAKDDMVYVAHWKSDNMAQSISATSLNTDNAGGLSRERMLALVKGMLLKK